MYKFDKAGHYPELWVTCVPLKACRGAVVASEGLLNRTQVFVSPHVETTAGLHFGFRIDFPFMMCKKKKFVYMKIPFSDSTAPS